MQKLKWPLMTRKKHDQIIWDKEKRDRDYCDQLRRDHAKELQAEQQKTRDILTAVVKVRPSLKSERDICQISTEIDAAWLMDMVRYSSEESNNGLWKALVDRAAGEVKHQMLTMSIATFMHTARMNYENRRRPPMYSE